MSGDKAMKRNALLPIYSEFPAELKECDVLLGERMRNVTMEENKVFRAMVTKYSNDYHSTEKLSLRDEIARRIMLTIRALGGRFLQRIELSNDFDNSTEAWIVADEDKILHDIKQAFWESPCNSQLKGTQASNVRRESLRHPSEALHSIHNLGSLSNSLHQYKRMPPYHSGLSGRHVGRFSVVSSNSYYPDLNVNHARRQYASVAKPLKGRLIDHILQPQKSSVASQLWLLRQRQRQLEEQRRNTQLTSRYRKRESHVY
jgi:hypothetical protein